jgi:hypothetical protein
MDRHNWFAVSVGAGNHEQSSPHEWKPELRTAKHSPSSIKPDSGKVSEDGLQSSSNQACDVFNDDDFWSNVANNSQILGPQSALLPFDSDFVHVGT